MITSERPYIFIIDRNTQKANIFELTLPFETNIESNDVYKPDK